MTPDATTSEPKFSRHWRPMKTAPKNGAVIEVLIYHANRKYAKRDEKSDWESTARARWIAHNGGGWTWNGMMGQFRGWRPTGKITAIAEKCADALLLACDSEPCQRLQLMRKEAWGERNMGGWCRDAIINQIVDVMIAESKETAL